jgi:hypothetical protein
VSDVGGRLGPAVFDGGLERDYAALQDGKAQAATEI